jgi:UTP--glucose-1-phosphate uridylyltransferase
LLLERLRDYPRLPACKNARMKALSKALFPVAGMGTRFLPATKSVPKEMITIVDRPIIHYAFDEAVAAGCETMIFITGRTKRAVEDYFDAHPELEAELAAKGKHEALAIVRNIVPPHVRCAYVRQGEPLGLGHAVRCAADLVGDEPFAVLLPDDLIDGNAQPCLAQLHAQYKRTGGSVIAVQQVPWEQVHQYGVVDLGGAEPKATQPARIRAVVEKPQRDQAPSNWAIVGRYILMPQVMAQLRQTQPGAGGEIQLTDAIAATLADVPTWAVPIDGERFDCGNRAGFVQANLHFARKLGESV